MVPCNKNNVGSSEQRYFLADDIFSRGIFVERRTRFLVQSQFPELRFFYQRNAPLANWPDRSVSLTGSRTSLSLNHLLNKSFLSSRPVRDMLEVQQRCKFMTRRYTSRYLVFNKRFIYTPHTFYNHPLLK